MTKERVKEICNLVFNYKLHPVDALEMLGLIKFEQKESNMTNDQIPDGMNLVIYYKKNGKVMNFAMPLDGMPSEAYQEIIETGVKQLKTGLPD